MDLASEYLLKSFRSGKADYLYCSRSSQIFRINPAMLEIIPLQREHTLAQVQETLKGIFSASEIAAEYSRVERLARGNGFFRRGGLSRRMAPFTDEELQASLERDLNQLTLEVTQNCNLRCHYCAYSGGYPSQRAHSRRSMTQRVAKDAIDFLYAKNRDCEQTFNLSFYGGEPLLALPLIRYCVDYARSLVWRNPEALSFSLTTNGVLLDDEAIRFLVANRFEVMASIDGPEPDHDAHRIFADGRGSFAKVMAAVRRYHELGGGEAKVSANCVITPTADLERVNDFFVENRDLFGSVSSSNVDAHHATFFRDYPGDPERQLEQVGVLFEAYRRAHAEPGPPVPERGDMTFIAGRYRRNFVSLFRRHVYGSPPDEVSHRPTCIPGKRKAFVDVDGRLHICERISDSCPIGDVWRGFDMQAIRRICNEYAAVMNRKECRDCWAFRFCFGCFANLAENGHASLERTKPLCRDVLRSAEGLLPAFCSILEENPHAFDYMKDYVIE